MDDRPETLPAEALHASVTGVGLSPGTLRDQLSEGMTLLVFLRHFGCMFCREAVSELRAAAELNPEFPSVLFFSQASATEGRAFLRRYWPGARVVADPQLEFYDLFGIPRASFLQGIGPKVLAAGARARQKGFSNGPKSGDVWRMPGIFAVRDERIVWAHQPEHAADHPEFARIPEFIEGARD